jgi:hypothetical protein
MPDDEGNAGTTGKCPANVVRLRIGDVLNNVMSTIVQAVSGHDDAAVLARIYLKGITYESNPNMVIERLLQQADALE